MYLWRNILCKTINILHSRYYLFFQFNYPLLWGWEPDRLIIVRDIGDVIKDQFTAVTFQSQWFWGKSNVADEFLIAENIDSRLVVEKDDFPQIESLKPLLGLLESHVHEFTWETPSPIDHRTILNMQHFLAGVAGQIVFLGRFQLSEGLLLRFLNWFSKSLIFGFLPNLLVLLDLV